MLAGNRGGGTRMKLEFSDGTYKVEDKASDTFFVGFNNYLFCVSLAINANIAVQIGFQILRLLIFGE